MLWAVIHDGIGDVEWAGMGDGISETRPHDEPRNLNQPYQQRAIQRVQASSNGDYGTYYYRLSVYSNPPRK